MRHNTFAAIAYLAMSFAFLGCQNSTWKSLFQWGDKPKDTSWQQPKGPDASHTVAFRNQALGTDTFIQIAKKADAGVVNIGTTQIIAQNPRGRVFGMPDQPGESPFDDLFRHFFGGEPFGQEAPAPEERKASSLGSGFILTKDGLIVTNNHVVEKASEIKVTIGSDREYIAKIVGTDPKTDVALIKIEPKEELHPLELGDSSALQVGEIVVAIGNPFGLSHTVTQGIVSAKERTIGFGPYDNFIQTDASINPGNSGGPLLNLEAKVVGINAAIVSSGQGIGFAIPIDLAKDILKQLQETGSVTRGWLGVAIQKVTRDIAENLNIGEPMGALVSEIMKDSPASKVDLKVGDLIIEVDGTAIHDSQELPRVIASKPVGKAIALTVLRNGKKITVHPVIEKLKNQDEEENLESKQDNKVQSADELGLVVDTLSRSGAQKYGYGPDVKGVIVKDVDPKSDAYDKQIRAGQVISKVGNQNITNEDDYRKAIKSNLNKDSVLLYVDRGRGGKIYVVVKYQKR